MNVAFFLKPKAEVGYLYDDFTVRQGLEKFRHYGYTAIPVIDREGKYVSTISEGDFLWAILNIDSDKSVSNLRKTEKMPIKSLLKQDKNPPVHIMASADELFNMALRQNFIPVIDDTGVFMGIVTRQEIMKYYYALEQKK